MVIPLDEPQNTTLTLSQNATTVTSTTTKLIQSIKNNNINNYNAEAQISEVNNNVTNVDSRLEKQRKYIIMGV